jgi:hypothetical protein
MYEWFACWFVVFYREKICSIIPHARSYLIFILYYLNSIFTANTSVMTWLICMMPLFSPDCGFRGKAKCCLNSVILLAEGDNIQEVLIQMQNIWGLNWVVRWYQRSYCYNIYYECVVSTLSRYIITSFFIKLSFKSL